MHSHALCKQDANSSPHSPLPVLPKAGTLLNCAKRAALLPDAATLRKATLQTSPSPKPKAKSAVPPGQQTPQGSVTRLADSGAFDSPVDLYIRVSLPLSTTSQHTQQSNTNPAATAYYATVRYSTLQYLLPLPRLLQYLLITRRSLQERTLSSIYKHLSPSLARSH